MLPIWARRPGLCNRLPVCDPEIGEISHSHPFIIYIILVIHDHLLNLLWAPFWKCLPPPPEEQHAVAFSLLTSMIIMIIMMKPRLSATLRAPARKAPQSSWPSTSPRTSLILHNMGSLGGEGAFSTTTSRPSTSPRTSLLLQKLHRSGTMTRNQEGATTTSQEIVKGRTSKSRTVLKRKSSNLSMKMRRIRRLGWKEQGGNLWTMIVQKGGSMIILVAILIVNIINQHDHFRVSCVWSFSWFMNDDKVHNKNFAWGQKEQSDFGKGASSSSLSSSPP